MMVCNHYASESFTYASNRQMLPISRPYPRLIATTCAVKVTDSLFNSMVQAPPNHLIHYSTRNEGIQDKGGEHNVKCRESHEHTQCNFHKVSTIKAQCTQKLKRQ